MINKNLNKEARRQLALKAVQEDGRSFRDHHEFHGDKEVAKAALSSYGHALVHVSYELFYDRELLKLALTSHGGVLRHLFPCAKETDSSLCADLELCEIAIKSDPFAIVYVDRSLMADAAIRERLVALAFEALAAQIPLLSRPEQQQLYEQLQNTIRELSVKPSVQENDHSMQACAAKQLEPQKVTVLPLRPHDDNVAASQPKLESKEPELTR